MVGRVDVERMKVWTSGCCRMHSKRGPKSKKKNLFSFKKFQSKEKVKILFLAKIAPFFLEMKFFCVSMRGNVCPGIPWVP